MADGGREQRRFPRVPVQKAVLVKKVGDDASEALARTRTVGAGGCSFLHHERLGVGQVVELLVALPTRVVRVQARVVWERPARPGEVEVGVEFTAVSAKDRSALDRALAIEAGAVR